jgi:ABC-type iron transport system FetAB ATPase subunit
MNRQATVHAISTSALDFSDAKKLENVLVRIMREYDK